MKRVMVNAVILFIMVAASPLNAQVPNEYIIDIVEKNLAVACRAQKQLHAYKNGYLEALACISKHNEEHCIELLAREVEPNADTSKLELNSCSKTVALSD